MVVGKDIIEYFLRADVLICRRLGVESLPEFVCLCEASFDLVAGKGIMNVGFGTTSVAGVATDPLPKKFLDRRDKRVPSRKVQAGEGDVRRCKTPCQGARVVALWGGDLLYRDLIHPESVCYLCLRDTIRSQMGIRPCHGAIPVTNRVVTIPCRCSVVALRSIVISLPMATHVQELVLDAIGGIVLQLRDLAMKALPLGQSATGIGWVCPVQETEVRGRVVER